MRALLAAMTCEKHALDANLAMHVEVLEDAARNGCRLVVFPEFSLTGSVDPLRHPEDAIAIDAPAVAALVAATGECGLAAVFGISERVTDRFFVTQVVARDGRLIGTQRKRHLGDDEHAYSIGSDTFGFDLGPRRFGIIICAEAGVDWTWDATAQAGAEIVLFCSAPGLDDPATDDEAWRVGFEWWEGCGLGDAVHHAARLGVSVAMATQAGATVDENFPGIAALVSADGRIVDHLPDRQPGTLIVDLPNDAADTHEPERDHHH
jgi:predicted amidohydrolase